MHSLHIIFPNPGHWEKFKIVSTWVDAEGYTHTERSTTIPAEHEAVMQQVVQTIVGLAAPWQARLVVPSLGRVEPDAGSTTQFEPFDVVELTVHARRVEDGATKVFSSADYPEFCITSPAAVDFYKAFTHIEQ